MSARLCAIQRVEPPRQYGFWFWASLACCLMTAENGGTKELGWLPGAVIASLPRTAVPSPPGAWPPHADSRTHAHAARDRKPEARRSQAPSTLSALSVHHGAGSRATRAAHAAHDARGDCAAQHARG